MYCKPWNAGLASETGAVARRLAKLVGALDNLIGPNVVNGEIVQEIQEFRYGLVEKLEAEGWTFSYRGGNSMRCYPPGSPTGAKVRASMRERYGVKS